MRRRRLGGVALSVAIAWLAGAACTQGEGLGRFPPPPPTPAQNLGPNEPPVIWLGGTLVKVGLDHLELLEPAGSRVSLQRLAGSATSFFVLSGSSWKQLGSDTRTGPGQAACVETLMDRANLVAIRVFLGAGCGPA